MDIIDIANNLKKVNPQRLMQIVARNNKKLLLDENREQMMDGKNILGEDMKPDYVSLPYARKKQTKNSRPAYGTPDLNWKGKYHKNMNIKIDAQEFEMNSRVPYAGYIAGYRGLGINPQANDLLNPVLMTELQLLWLKSIGL